MKLPEYALGEKTATQYMESLEIGLQAMITNSRAAGNVKKALPFDAIEELADFFLQLTQHAKREMENGNI